MQPMADTTAGVRPASQADLPAILDLAEAKREEYQRYQPTFWRKAGASRAKHEAFLTGLLEDAAVLLRVHEHAGVVDGFIIGHLPTPPPVYDPGGPVLLVDDFATRDAQDWATVGAALLAAVTAEAKARGALLAVVICGHLDAPKRAMLAGAGYGVASEWHTRTL
jgi:hypothetical protein